MNERNQAAPRSTGDEPWLRGTLTDVPAVPRAVLHALELAREDIERWCAGLSDDEIQARPAGLASLAFQIRHIANAADRLLTYAEGRELSPEQLAAARTENDSQVMSKNLLFDFAAALDRGAERVRALAHQDFEQPRAVGRKRLPTTLGGLLVHIADHTQRHVGQAVVTAKLVKAARENNSPMSAQREP